LILILVISGVTVLLFSQELLTIDTGNQKADVLLVLGGGFNERPERAAELFKEGVAPRVLVSGFGDCKQSVQLLEKTGVPADVITEEGNSRNTLENAKFSIPLLRHMGAHEVVIVTSWYHTRRAMACFEHFAPEIKFYSRPSYVGYQRQEWISRGILQHSLSECLKLLGYWVCYGVSPFQPSA
jgi:uncharacterized SAM-binding protein YcdF (DUF218 family)